MLVSRRILALAAILLLVGCATAYAMLAAPRVTDRTPGQHLDTSSPSFALQVRNVGALKGLRATVDGLDTTRQLRVTREGVVLSLTQVDEGEHTVRVWSQEGGPFGWGIDERWKFTVDVTPPQLLISQPPEKRLKSPRANIAFVVKTEPEAVVRFRSRGETTKETADESGTIRHVRRFPDGSHTLIATAYDKAGNHSFAVRQIYIDTRRPGMRVNAPRVARDTGFTAQVVANDASKVEVKARVGEAAAQQTAKPARNRFTFTAPAELAEGVHTLHVEATDIAGNTTTQRRTVLLDSTEQLGSATVSYGARGADVRQLHEQLAERELFSSSANPREWSQRRYGDATTAAVRKFQQEQSLAVDGVVGGDTLAALTLKIVIDQGSHTLTLYRMDETVASYPVAVGSPKYPTPNGEFRIVDMQVNPTWRPPDSDWAKGEKPIPPGPDNPLGTRWMGLDVPAVGIHGTPSPESLGYSVSHGCIRMAIPDVEVLFEQVELGTPVVIQP